MIILQIELPEFSSMSTVFTESLDGKRLYIEQASRWRTHMPNFDQPFSRIPYLEEFYRNAIMSMLHQCWLNTTP